MGLTACTLACLQGWARGVLQLHICLPACQPQPPAPACLSCTCGLRSRRDPFARPPRPQDRGACALFMYPTKALAQDQLRALRELVAAAFGAGGGGEGGQGPPAVEVYDGDTPMADR